MKICKCISDNSAFKKGDSYYYQREVLKVDYGIRVCYIVYQNTEEYRSYNYGLFEKYFVDINEQRSKKLNELLCD